MDLSLGQLRTCPFRREIDNVYQKVQTPSLDVTQVFHLSESIVDTLKDPSRCDDGCHQSLDYAQILLECVARLMDFLDNTWSSTCRETASDPTESMHGRTATYRGYASTMSSSNSQPPTSAIVSLDTVAAIGKFVLDESERDLILQEMLRTMMISMNEVVSTIRLRISQSSRALELGHLDTLSSTLLEQTYSALARYERRTGV